MQPTKTVIEYAGAAPGEPVGGFKSTIVHIAAAIACAALITGSHPWPVVVAVWGWVAG